MTADIKKWAPAGAVAVVGVVASEVFTKDKGTLWRVLGAVVGATAGLIIGAKLDVVK